MMLPQEAQYDFLADLSTDKDIAAAINDAMRLIEKEYPYLEGILPKNYQDFERDLLASLVRVFNKDAVKKATGDVFGRIYEYFLMKFSMQGAGAQEGGEFFTPPSLVQLLVSFIEPDHGIIHDPACGSGGMFVQTGRFVRNQVKKDTVGTINCYGTELKTNNYKLAKMNLAIHGIEGKISENNSFYTDPHGLVGQCDFVLANPPFNVNKIDKDKQYVKNDPRLSFGLPKSDNGNYMWIQYFHSYLNEKRRAGFVIASSATDAGHTEAVIRQRLIESKHVDCIVSVSNNFFYTRSLPCHLWFFDKGKSVDNADKILMIDARNVYRVVSTTINDFSAGQSLNLTTIMRLYRGVVGAFADAEAQHRAMLNDNLQKIYAAYQILVAELEDIETALSLKFDFEPLKSLEKPSDTEGVQSVFDTLFLPVAAAEATVKMYQDNIETVKKQVENTEIPEKEGKATIQAYKKNVLSINRPLKKYAEATDAYAKDTKQGIADWQQLKTWFPLGKYQDTEGVCKIVSIEEVKQNDYSLTPGRYVGVSTTTDKDFDYKKRLRTIGQELTALNQTAAILSQQITESIREMI